MLAALLGLPQTSRDDPQSRYRETKGATPGPARGDDGPRHGLPAHPAGGDAPWALSALPGCFHQEHFASGDDAFVRSKLPPGAQPVVAGSVLATADCRLQVRARDATVVRGENVFHVPPPAYFFVAEDRLFLETRQGARATLRTYVIVAGGPPRFARTRPK